MKVLVAGACLQPGWTGGEPWVARVIGDGLKKRGWEVVEDPALRPTAGLIGMATSPLDWDLASVRNYERRLREVRPEVVLGFYNYDDSLTRAARNLGIPFVSSLHIYWPLCPVGTLYIEGQGVCPGPALGRCLAHMSSNLPPTRLPLNLRSLPPPAALIAYAKARNRHEELGAASAVVVPGEHVRRALEARGYRNLWTIAIGKAVGSIRPHDWSGGKKIVLFASGTPSERKGFHHFEEVARRLRPRFPEADFVATSFGGNVEVRGTGRLAYDDVMQVISSAYVVLAPSLWDEPFSGAVIEALASGKPVVAYDTGGMPEIIGDAGVLVHRGDVEGLTEAVRGLLSDPSRTVALGQAARRRAERLFDLERMIDAYSDLLRRAAERTLDRAAA